jgi:predicted restriction endonuclease
MKHWNAAAHLIPFSESRNDHPTNGLALCKKHCLAMDRVMPSRFRPEDKHYDCAGTVE